MLFNYQDRYYQKNYSQSGNYQERGSYQKNYQQGYYQNNYHQGNEQTQPQPSMCKFFLEGRCIRGKNCRFSHDIPNKNSPQQDITLISFNNPTTPSLLEIIENDKKSPQKFKVGVNHFEILAQIGHGYVGKVYQVRMKQNSQIYAMKVIPKQKVLESSLFYSIITERHIMMGIVHPFIIKLHYAFQTSSKLYLIMDYLAGGDLAFHLNNAYSFPEDRVQFYAAEIALALQFLHRQQIIYRDLKAANTLLDKEGHVRLADFGMAKLLLGTTEEEQKTNSYCGTTCYMAPEIIHNSNYGYAIDWWSFGVLIFQMLTGEFPFDDEDPELIPQKVMNDKLQFPNSLSQNSKSLLRGLLDKNPKTRLKELQINQHSFFSSIDWIKLEKKEITPSWKPYLEDEVQDLSNFPSDVTSGTPKDVESKETKLKFEQFSYCSPTVESFLADAIANPYTTEITIEWSEEEDEIGNLEVEGEGQEGQEDEEENEENQVHTIPDEGCFAITL